MPHDTGLHPSTDLKHATATSLAPSVLCGSPHRPHPDGAVLRPRRVHLIRGSKAHGVHGAVVPLVAVQLLAGVVAEEPHPPVVDSACMKGWTTHVSSRSTHVLKFDVVRIRRQVLIYGVI